MRHHSHLDHAIAGDKIAWKPMLITDAEPDQGVIESITPYCCAIRWSDGTRGIFWHETWDRLHLVEQHKTA